MVVFRQLNYNISVRGYSYFDSKKALKSRLVAFRKRLKEYLIERMGESIFYSEKNSKNSLLYKSVLINLSKTVKHPIMTMQKFVYIFNAKIFGWSKIYQTYQKGKFCNRGEKHLWMYDEVTLSDLLKKTGFNMTERMDFNVSNLKNFSKYMLEVDARGKEYKPNSLYIEGR